MFKAIIIDDEKSSHETLELLIKEKFPDEITICAMCNSAKEGRAAVQQHDPNLIFLDIDMPGESGFDFIDSFHTINFETIFITAYNEYAIKAFRYHAVDYLLKPVNPDDFTASIHWLKQRITNRHSNEIRGLSELLKNYLQNQQLGISTAEGIVFLDVTSIIRCEGSSNYTYIYAESGKKLLVARTLKDFEDILCTRHFLRVHKSHIINIQKMARYHRSEAIIELHDGSKIPLSRTSKEEFEKTITVI